MEVSLVGIAVAEGPVTCVEDDGGMAVPVVDPPRRHGAGVAVHDAGVSLHAGLPEGLKPGNDLRVQPPLGAPRSRFGADDLDGGEVTGEPVEEHLAYVDRGLFRSDELSSSHPAMGRNLRCSGVVRHGDRRRCEIRCPGRDAVDRGGEGFVAEPGGGIDHDGSAFRAEDDGTPFEEGAEGGDVEGADLALAGRLLRLRSRVRACERGLLTCRVEPAAARCSVLVADLEANNGCARSVSDMDDDLGVPNCERCLVPMMIEGADEGPSWCCPECRIVRLA